MEDLDDLDDDEDGSEARSPFEDPASAAKQLLDGYLEELNSGSSLHAVTRSALDGDQPTEVAACLDIMGLTLVVSNGASDPVLAWAWFDLNNPQHRGALRALRGAIDQALEQGKPRA